MWVYILSMTVDKKALAFWHWNVVIMPLCQEASLPPPSAFPNFKEDKARTTLHL